MDDLDVECGCDPIVPLLGNINISSSAAAQAFCGQYNTVYGSMTVDGAVLTDVDDLACLCEVSSDLTFDQAPNLERIELPLLHTVGGDLVVWENEFIDRITLPSLTNVGGDLLVYLFPVYGLNSLDLAVLESIGGDFWMHGVLIETISYPALTEVGGHLWFGSNEYALLFSFPELASVGEFVSMSQYTPLSDSSVEFPVLETVGDVFSVNSGSVLELRCPQLALIGGELGLSNQYSTISFPVLAEAQGGLQISHVEVLDGTFDMPALRSLGGDGLDIWKSLSPTPPLTYTLSALELVDGDLVVEGAGPDGVDRIMLVDLPLLAEVTGDVDIEWTMTMPAVSWPYLAVIGGDLAIHDNGALVDITGLFGVESIGGSLWIGDNPVLPTAEAWALLATIGHNNIGGNASIQNNGP